MARQKISTACVVLAAGQGTRMRSEIPKVMHKVANKPMLGHVLETAAQLKAEEIITVLGPDMPKAEAYVKKYNPKAKVVNQEERLGTGHAVQQARDVLAGFDGVVFVLYGDTPLITAQTVSHMAEAMQEHQADVAVLGMHPVEPGLYGRLIVDDAGNLTRIVEAKDATDQEKSITLCNSGVMAVSGAKLFNWLDKLDNNNANGEFYLTDVVALANADDCVCRVVDASMDELLGVNDRVQLAQAESILQQRLRLQAMQAGVTLIDPASVYFSADTQLGQDVTVEPNVFFGPGVKVERNVVIRANSHLEQVRVQEGATVGPFARLRPGTDIGKDAKIGNFVEIKKAIIDEGAKVSHLSYIGDAHIGAFANVGAGTITCNYDGFQKYHTDIGKHAFIGSNTALVAPVAVGEGAIIGAGSVITEDVEGDALSMNRTPQQHKQAWARNFRRKKQN